MTPPPLLSSHAKHDKFARQIVSAIMPKCEKRGGGVSKPNKIVLPLLIQQESNCGGGDFL